MRARRGFGRAALALALAAAALAPLAAPIAPAAAAPAQGPAPRTIVVRGRTFSPGGAPLAGARVMVRGSASVSAVTDDRGRYTLSVPLGMPAALQRLPFRIEVRAEDGGRRLPLAGGGASLVIEADWPASSDRPRVRSNREAAVTAVATALGVEGVNLAWVEADFGAAPPAAGGATAATTPAPRNSVPPPAPRNSVPPSAPRNSAPPPAPRNGAPPPVPRNSASAAMPRSGTPVAVAPPVAAPRNSVPAPAPAPAPANVRRDSAAAAPPSASAAAPRPGAPPARRGGAADTAARIVASARTVEAPPPRPSPVRAIDPYAARDTAPAADSCRCALRGTVEIRWDRPLEEHTTVHVELDAPGAKPQEVSLFMGAPREFRFGPLPCGDWKLTVRARGKFRYADARGDTARVVPCAGATETRVVLAPVRR